ncbi:MAG: imidazole glycerol phosphate synthase subunit HisH [Planctomycetota bacterium]
MSKQVIVVDYQLGNVFSVMEACRYVGLNVTHSRDPDQFESADALILPGVGAFGDAMESLQKLGLDKALRRWSDQQRPLMGICLGMQLLFEESTEFGHHSGLSLIPGTVERLPSVTQAGSKLRVPKVGWSPVQLSQGFASSELAKGIDGSADFYFVHSYYAKPASLDDVAATCCHGDFSYCCAVRRGGTFATQFHPEKSSEVGITLLRNFGSML